ncbi:MAG: hypothetical protein HY741_18180 [Chloroflexi bacterium]|nr:hypothetical protein [Chloroflexota bacterium]
MANPLESLTAYSEFIAEWVHQPNIKHHRVPAPNISFEKPNLPELIREIVAIGGKS